MLNSSVLFACLLLLLAFPCCVPKKVASGSTLQSPAKTSIAWTASWSYDDRYIAIGNDAGELSIYETVNWKKVKSWRYSETTITRVEWNPKYPVLAVAVRIIAGTPPVVQLYDVENDRTLMTVADTLQGRGVTWKPDGEKVAFVGARGRISLYTREGAHLKTLSHTNPRSLLDIDWHPAENLLLAVEEDIYLIATDRDSLIATYDDGSQHKGILCCQWHPSGEFFVTGDYGHENEGEPSYLKYWKKDGTLIKRIRESRSEYRNVRWSRDGRYLAAAGDVLLVFNERGERVMRKKFDGNKLWGVEWNHKGDRIITSDQAGNIRHQRSTNKNLCTIKQSVYLYNQTYDGKRHPR